MSTQSQAPALPDVNAETYPYEVVQHMLDQTASVSFFAIPNPAHKEQATLTPGNPGDFFGINGGYGIDVESSLHRFESNLRPSDQRRTLDIDQAVGESVGGLQCRWIFGTDKMTWTPGHEPPVTIFDPWRAQRFAVTEARFNFGPLQGFQAYGVGRTFPQMINGKHTILAGAVGNITEGKGKFRRHEGTFVMAGTLTENLGFRGSVTCRIVDPQDSLQSRREIYPLTAIPDPDPASVFLVMRGVKKDRTVKTTFGPPPGPDLVSLITPSQMRSVQLGFMNRGPSAPLAGMRVGQVIADMEADVAFNLLAPPGNAEHPVPFTTREVYKFLDASGAVTGTVLAGVVEGISFDLKFPGAPGQPGVRFAGFGPVTGGTGQFEGAQGILTVNSVIGIAPHALSLLHVLHLVDPQQKLRNRNNR
jgi:hypothetical protein